MTQQGSFQQGALERRATAHRMAARGTQAVEIARVLATSAEVVQRWLRMPRPDITTASKPDLSWQDKALCAQVGGDLWHPEPGQLDVARKAKQICGICESQMECLEDALRTGDAFAIQGGYTARERRDMKRQRRAA